jgi:large subunit ribosomal protein L23
MSDFFDILRKPIVSEKASDLQAANKFTFEVDRAANKHQIKIAVEEAFGVNVVNVNVLTLRRKRKKFGPRESKLSFWKKAIVTLKQGDTITMYEGV